MLGILDALHEARSPEPRSGMGGFWVLILLFVAAGASTRCAPAAKGVDAPLHEFSAGRALEHLQEIAVAPHPTGSAEGRRVAETLVEALNELGCAVTIPEAPHTRWLINILGELPGSSDRPGLLLVAHHDSTPSGPGASDDGAGVAALLEIARALAIDEHRTRPITFLFTDGEELGLFGIRALLQAKWPFESYAAVLNVEATGNRGATVLFETAGDTGDLIAAWSEGSPSPAGSSLYQAIYDALPNNTDFSPIRRSGLRGLNFALVGGNSAYHAPFDTPEHLDRGSLQAMGDTLLGTVRAWDRRGQGSAPRRVFHDVIGRWVISIDAAWAPWLAGIVGILLTAWILRTATFRLLPGALLFIGFTVLIALGSKFLQPYLDRGAEWAVTRFYEPHPRGDAMSTWCTALGLVLFFAAGARLLARKFDTCSSGLVLQAGRLLWSIALFLLAYFEPEFAVILTVPVCAGVLSSATASRFPWLSGALAGISVMWLVHAWFSVVLLTSKVPAISAAAGATSLWLGLPLLGDAVLSSPHRNHILDRTLLATGFCVLGIAALGRASGW